MVGRWLVDVDILELIAKVIWDGGVVLLGFLKDLLARLVDDVAKVTMPLRAGLRREHDRLQEEENQELRKALCRGLRGRVFVIHKPN